MAGFIDAIRATLTEMAGTDAAEPPALPAKLPEAVRPVANQCVQDLITYQGPSYAQLYLDRLRRFIGRKGVDDALFIEIARLLALRMCYEDPISLAQLALEAHRRGTPVDEKRELRLDELVSALPEVISEQLLELLDWLRWRDKRVRMRFHSTSRIGRRRLRIEASLRRWRMLSPHYVRERALVERWLHMIDRCLTKQPAAVAAVVRTAELLRGCGLAYRNKLIAWNLIIDGLAKPVFDGALVLPDLSCAINRARAAVGDDLQQAALRQTIADIRAEAAAATAAAARPS
uniref:DUF6537 domain-containing protein n=1 Tax=Rhodopseudomonas palustris (strain BisA53) TaxID=316055 RepID=Q07JY9_RHOP5